MTPPAAAAPARPARGQLSERLLQELVSDYYLAQVAQTRLDYIPSHKEGLITTPLEYKDGAPIEVEVSAAVAEGVLRLCDLGAVNEYLGHCDQRYPRKIVDALHRSIEHLCEPEGVMLDSCEGLYLYTPAGRYVEYLHRFIMTLVRIDALFRAFFLDAELAQEGER